MKWESKFRGDRIQMKAEFGCATGRTYGSMQTETTNEHEGTRIKKEAVKIEGRREDSQIGVRNARRGKCPSQLYSFVFIGVHSWFNCIVPAKVRVSAPADSAVGREPAIRLRLFGWPEGFAQTP